MRRRHDALPSYTISRQEIEERQHTENLTYNAKVHATAAVTLRLICPKRAHALPKASQLSALVVVTVCPERDSHLPRAVFKIHISA